MSVNHGRVLMRSPSRKTVADNLGRCAHDLDRNAAVRSRDHHGVRADRFVQTPRGTHRLVAEYFAASKPRSCPHRGSARRIAARRRACTPFVVPMFPDTLAKTRYAERRWRNPLLTQSSRKSHPLACRSFFRRYCPAEMLRPAT
jgi:hypothetical protein